ncbi:MAG: aspartate aminotransferase family protein [Candidatus Korarchaeota archaeon]|nr:aspartate aminotransferase family protein [Candidatus Korarchaeota archaeon]NIU82874.1 aminotransferase class III-fold pyridoxal phosphate-dependent enzyme [Candidatus Thorarchaeota archaeon]NIW12568.1 aminotransferase class III-fold pyridoxal phosphate-dependent enzyme [Candidatus Thorarchaeota archaeon]NIW50788.1 aminotransferase class III-fold pyridoxal phosphate-dependent enzyme [Candidatus Korarchaeota archaeon]
MVEKKLSKILTKYRKTHKESRKLWERAKDLFPGGTSHNIRTWGLPDIDAYPFFIKNAKGCKIWDEDGREYIDFWIGHLALIFGHTPDFIIQAIREQALHGTHWGVVNRKAVELATLIRESVPSIEMLSFANTGTEATMYAVRLARAYTGRNTVVKIRSGWHGANSELTCSLNYPFDVPESSGLIPENEKYCLSIPFNDNEETQAVLREYKDEIACVILEPVLGKGGGIPAEKEYLKLLRDLANDYGFCLIFDEVITGVRLGLGGAQAHYNVIPDLTVLGKTTGGGLPIGVVGGKRDIMELAEPNWNDSRSVLIGGGTFSINPMTMTAGLAALKKIREEGENLFKKLNERGDYIRNELRQILGEYKQPTKVTGSHSIVMLHFLQREIDEVSPENLQKFKAEKESVEFRLRLLNRGIFEFHGFGALCTEHKRRHIETYLETVRDVTNEMDS